MKIALWSIHFSMLLNQLSKHFCYSDWSTRISKTCILNTSTASLDVENRWSLLLFFILHYIIGHYNPSVRIADLVSHTTYVVCVGFIHKWQDLQFKVDFEQQIFWETFHGSFLSYSQSFCQKSAERKSTKKYF